MKENEVDQQIAAILEHNGIPYSKGESGFILRFSSSVIHLRLEWVLALRSPVLRGVLPEHRAPLLDALNVLNCDSHFGKWALYDTEDLSVSLEYDLLADHLQEAELMTAVTTVARLADQQDDVLQRRFGGLRAQD
jgi:T3SS (YopN, CesT) and YbjN peptide-binding chaperone 1